MHCYGALKRFKVFFLQHPVVYSIYVYIVKEIIE